MVPFRKLVKKYLTDRNHQKYLGVQNNYFGRSRMYQKLGIIVLMRYTHIKLLAFKDLGLFP